MKSRAVCSPVCSCWHYCLLIRSIKGCYMALPAIPNGWRAELILLIWLEQDWQGTVVQANVRLWWCTPVVQAQPWSQRVMFTGDACVCCWIAIVRFWTCVRKWRRSQSHCHSFCAPWVSKWKPIQMETFGFLSGSRWPRHLATPHGPPTVPSSIRHACAGPRPAAVSRCCESCWGDECGCMRTSWASLFVDLLFIKIKLGVGKHNLFVSRYSSRSAGTLLCSLACLFVFSNGVQGQFFLFCAPESSIFWH